MFIFFNSAFCFFGISNLYAGSNDLVIGHSSLPAGLANPLLDTSHSGGFVFRTVFNLYTTSTKDGAKAEMLTSWKVNPDDKTKMGHLKFVKVLNFIMVMNLMLKMSLKCLIG